MNTIPVKYLFNIFSGSTPASGNTSFWDGDFNWFTPDDLGKIGTEVYVNESSRKVSSLGITDANLRFAEPNSIIITKRAPIGNLAINIISSSCNQGCFILEPDLDKVEVKFYYYFFLVQKKRLNLLGRGATFLELNADDMKSFRVPFPSLPTQKKIVAFLDKELSIIDKLISKKKRLVELIKEKQKVIEFNAIYKGLNSLTLTKPVANFVVSDIPSDWRITKLKYVSNLKSGDFITAEDISESGDYRVFGGNGLRGYTSRHNQQGDFVLIGRQGALCGNINFASGIFWATEHAIVCHPISDFDCYWLGKQLELMDLNQYSLAAAQPGLSVEVLKNLFIVVPSLQEQIHISLFLQDLEKKSSLVKEKILKSIELLIEKRNALVSAAVTGVLKL